MTDADRIAQLQAQLAAAKALIHPNCKGSLEQGEPCCFQTMCDQRNQAQQRLATLEAAIVKWIHRGEISAGQAHDAGLTYERMYEINRQALAQRKEQ